MSTPSAIDDVLAKLNPQQRQAATHGEGPLLIVAGAGTGKTATLVHRVAWLIAGGVDPSRILLLTFTRRAAAEMLRRVDAILRQLARAEQATAEESTTTPAANLGRLQSARVWGGTFHAIATRLLRRHGKAIGLPVEFTIHDRGDSEDLVNVVRTELHLAKTDKRFPKKGTCMAIYSRCVNARQKLEPVLANHFPWCREWSDELKRLFNGYLDHKEAAAILDYDDLLLYWHALLTDPKTADVVRRQFDCVLVDEYQDTNVLQAEILYALVPDGKGLTVVGDDAQSIYSFRAATVRNILDFPKHYRGTTVVALEQNYRSTEPILAATNQVIGLAPERYTKNLWSEQTDGQRPSLVHCEDEDDQTDFVLEQVLAHRESGIDLRRQAVLFRASHHSMVLEAELARRNIPFHKYGGLKFVETAHVKDLMAFLRLAENPRDVVAGGRLLPLLPGIGPGKARQLMQQLLESGGDFGVWMPWKPPAGSATLWPALVKLLEGLARPSEDLPAQVHRVRKFYTPLLEQRYDHAPARLRDLEQLELIASRYRSRRTMLTEITLDPPSSTQDLAGPPHLDDDYLVLSTIHSAKGLEWDAVYVIHAADGNIPSDMATRNPEEIEEERRLFYVALTRAKSWLYVCCPLRYYYYQRPGVSDRHGFAQRTRFLPQPLLEFFEQRVTSAGEASQNDEDDAEADVTSRAVRQRTKDLW
ncbi:MAG: ATP-dependent helicase [Pirellulales bacterium]|nr:ATP-dependent helicase [Pirellulales bacterium]